MCTESLLRYQNAQFIAVTYRCGSANIGPHSHFPFILTKRDCFLIEERSHWGAAKPQLQPPGMSEHSLQSAVVQGVRTPRNLTHWWHCLPRPWSRTEGIGWGTAWPPGAYTASGCILLRVVVRLQEGASTLLSHTACLLLLHVALRALVLDVAVSQASS